MCLADYSIGLISIKFLGQQETEALLGDRCRRPPGGSLEALALERVPLYRCHADLRVRADLGSVDAVVDALLSGVRDRTDS
ncbi:MAG: hypothetical protein QGI55_02525 [Pseudomonadales bacterium]|nr:hypothetical protein [Pseudomonadales bacterium]